MAAATPGAGAELPLPRTAQPLRTRIAAACPECRTTGYVACGTKDVRWGTAFPKTAFQGTPPRAYLPTFTMTGDDFRRLARTTDYPTLLATLEARLAKTRLVILERGFADARVLAHPTKITVTFPRPLHTCVHDTELPWGCCVSDCKKECCEKGLGSPEVVLEWNDADEIVTFHYRHTVETTWLGRKRRDRLIRYACLTEAKGELR